jgi:hypothetical protein
MAEARYLISMAESDRATIQAWAERCAELAVSDSVAGAVRKAVELAESLPDHEVQRGYA